MTTIRGPFILGTNLTAVGDTVNASGGGGGGTVGPGTAGYVAFFTGTNSVGDSTIKDTGTAGTGVVLTLGTLTTPDNPGTYGTGVDLRVTTGAGGSLGGNGGGIVLATGTAIAGYAGGGIYLSPGGGGAGGSIVGVAGQSTGSFGGPSGGTVQFVGGASAGTDKAGGIQLSGGASSQGDGGDVLVASGGGSSVSGTGAGGNVTITAEIGKDSAHNGNLTLVVTKGTTGGGFLIVSGLPTSASGLPSGALWLNSNVLTRVP